MENIYPRDFFPIEHPDAPLVNVQFRTKITGEPIESSQNWESVTFNPSSFFESLTLEDRGGAQQVTLNLFDKNYARLENIVVKSILSARLSNRLVEEPNYTEDDSGFFQFYVARTSSVNLRIRFGYSQVLDDVDYIEEVDTASEAWKGRVREKKLVSRSPWIYLRLSGVKFRPSTEGLKIEIKAFSTTSSFLDKAKMIQKFAKLRGTPVDILENIGRIVNEAAQQSSGGKETVVFDLGDDPPIAYPDSSEDTAEGEIEIMLGTESAYLRYENVEDRTTIAPLYKSLRQILTEICSKVKPKIYDADGNEIEEVEDNSFEGNGIDEQSERITSTAPYGYVIEEEEDVTTLRFYYQDPNEAINNQNYVRTYVWNEDGHSIVRNASLETKTDFATLNVPIATINSDGGEMTLHVATGLDSNADVDNLEDAEDEDSIMDFNLGNLTNVSAALESPDFDAMFVAEVKDTSGFESSNEAITAQRAAAIISRRLVASLNRQIFTGIIELTGDPFYLFDASLKPFSYLINLIINRPNYLDENGEFVEGGKSYSSGLYAISKITHSISTSGFVTRLDVMKWPT